MLEIYEEMHSLYTIPQPIIYNSKIRRPLKITSLLSLKSISGKILPDLNGVGDQI